FLLVAIQRRQRLFVGVQTALLLVALVGALASSGHQSRGLERLITGDVDLAPDAALAPRREADGVGVLAERFADAVDPAEAQRLVARLRPVDRRLAAALLPKADQQLRRGRVVRLQPAAEIGLGGEEGWTLSFQSKVGS